LRLLEQEQEHNRKKVIAHHVEILQTGATAKHVTAQERRWKTHRKMAAILYVIYRSFYLQIANERGCIHSYQT